MREEQTSKIKKFLDPDMPKYDGEERPRPAAPEALRLAKTMIALDLAAVKLETARYANSRKYSGQYAPEDFFRYEQETFNRAAEAFADAVVAVVNKANS